MKVGSIIPSSLPQSSAREPQASRPVFFVTWLGQSKTMPLECFQIQIKKARIVG